MDEIEKKTLKRYVVWVKPLAGGVKLDKEAIAANYMCSTCASCSSCGGSGCKGCGGCSG